jgi:hypothetical protein
MMPLSLTSLKTSADVKHALTCLDTGYDIQCCSPSCLLEVVSKLNPENLAVTKIFDFDLEGAQEIPIDVVRSVANKIVDILCSAGHRYSSAPPNALKIVGDKWEARMETNHGTGTPARLMAAVFDDSNMAGTQH